MELGKLNQRLSYMTEQGGQLRAMDGDVGGAAGDGTHWLWALASAAQFGWGMSSFTRGYACDSRHMPLKGFAVASLFVGGAASVSAAVLQSYGNQKVEDAMEVGAATRTRLGLNPHMQKKIIEDS